MFSFFIRRHARGETMLKKVIHMLIHRCGQSMGITAEFRCITCAFPVDTHAKNVDNLNTA